MEKDLINSSKVVSNENKQPKIEWEDYSSTDYCKTKCEFYEKCSANRERCVKKHIDNFLKLLTETEEIVLKLHWGFCTDRKFTLCEIADYLAVTPERIRQIESKAIRKLRHPSRFASFKRETGIDVGLVDVDFYKKVIATVKNKEDK